MATKTNTSKKTAVSQQNKKAGMTKQEALRQALVHLGKDAKPLELRTHIKKAFGIDISTAHISAVKTGILRKMAGGAQPAPAKSPAAPQAAATTPTAPKPAAKPAAAKPKVAPAAMASANGRVTNNAKAGGAISLEVIQVTKDLIGRVGPSQLRALIDLLAN